MVRGRDACWEHCVLVDATRQKVRCNYCQREFSGGVYRMKFHLAQIKNKDIVPCAEVPDYVRDQIQSILRTPKKQKPQKKQKLELAINGQDHNAASSTSSGPHQGSSRHNGSTSPSLLLPHSSPSGQLAIDDPQKPKWDNADKKIASFFIQNSIPFNAAKSIRYKEMVHSIMECGVEYIPPSYNKMRSSLVNKVKADVNDWYKKLRDEWREMGCTILCECSIGRPTMIIAFSVTCPKGTVFIKSVDVSGRSEDAHYLFELIESVVLEVGVEHVVQVLTDFNASYIYAGRLLVAKYPSLFWSPCASNCINKMLEDLSKKAWVSTILEEAGTITRYMYSHTWTRNTMRKFTNGAELAELTQPKIFTFVSKFLSLRAILIQEDNLKHMFSTTDGIKTILSSERFWKLAHEVVSVSEPLVKILRMVDGDMPAMGYIYGEMERAKMEIKAYYKGVQEKYVAIWDIINTRWNVQLNSPLHAAAAFLNPSCFYANKIDTRMRNGFQEAMLRMVKEDRDKLEITKEHIMYINAQGALSTEFAIMGRTLNAPGDWWAGYGYEIPTLQRAAIRILSQPCSSHWCKWNWSTFETLHNNKRQRNKIEAEKFNDLVYVHCNLWLQSISTSRDIKCNKPINFDEIDFTLEWPTESESSTPLFDDSWLENLPLES